MYLKIQNLLKLCKLQFKRSWNMVSSVNNLLAKTLKIIFEDVKDYNGVVFRIR